MKYKFPLMTQTQIGRLFGVSSHEVGRWLEAAGLRATGKPSRQAHQEGYCDTAPSRGQGYCWAWRPEKTVAALLHAGHKPVSPPPLDLVEPPTLNGPFTLRASDGGTSEVFSQDGGVAVLVQGDENAAWILRLLNAAHRYGVLPRTADEPQVGV